MGHLVNAKAEAYKALAERLSKAPEGVVINESMMQILHQIYTESEAAIGSKFSLAPMTLDKIASVTGLEEEELKKVLDRMARKGLVLDLPRKDSVFYMLVPVVVGFFEYTFMRTGDNVNHKDLAELFEQYFHAAGVKDKLYSRNTQAMRTLVYENLIPLAVETEVLDYERAAEIIKQAGGGSISTCPCRHKAAHLGRACGAPEDVCTSLGTGAEWLVRRGLAKPATTEELLAVLDKTEKLGLVHLCDNVLNKPAYICHCCGCCCEVLSAVKEGFHAAHPSNFIPILQSADCLGCGLCSDRCQIKAIEMKKQADGTKLPVVSEKICIGCGACAAACPSGALGMSRRTELYIPPANSREKFQRFAEEMKS
jgi:Pyruvate/2-oxoacid:ferredoxin oxidoreductase delta subunit